jgi:hypothetical protein
MINVIYIFSNFQNWLLAVNTKTNRFAMKHQLEGQKLRWVVLRRGGLPMKCGGLI